MRTQSARKGLGPVARSLVSANRWLRGIKLYRFPWYLTLVSTNHASSNPGLDATSGVQFAALPLVKWVLRSARTVDTVVMLFVSYLSIDSSPKLSKSKMATGSFARA